MAYNTKDAQEALDRLGASLSSDGKKQYEAAKRLLQELAKLRKPNGTEIVYTDSECVEITVRHGPWRRVWLGGRDMKFKISDNKVDQSMSTRDLEVAVDYDPVGDRFVGTEDDPSIVPAAGGKRVKRDALAVLIDAIALDIHSHE